MKRVASRLLLAAGSLLLATAASAQVPPPPSHLTAKAVHFPGDENAGLFVSVQLSWMEVVPPDGEGQHVAFRIYRSVDDSTSFAPLSVTADRAFGDRDVLTGHTCFCLK